MRLGSCSIGKVLSRGANGLAAPSITRRVGRSDGRTGRRLLRRTTLRAAGARAGLKDVCPRRGWGPLPVRRPAHAAGQGVAGALAATCWPASRRRATRSGSRRRWRWPTCRSATFLDEPLIPYERRRGHAADRRHARRGGVRAGRAPHRRRVPRLAALLRDDERRAGGAGARASRRRWPPRSPSSCGIRTCPGRAASAASSPGSATRSACRAGSRSGCSPTIRPTTRAASAPSILDGLLYGCGDAVIGINPATDSPQTVRSAARDARRAARALRDPDAVLRAGARHDAASRRCERGAPVDLVFQSIAGTEAANASFGVNLALLDEAQAGGARAGPRHAGRQRDVLRDRPGLRALGRGAPRRRPADARGPGLRRGARASSRCWSTPSSASSARSTCTTASRSSAPGSKTTSAASCSACRWAATSATRTTPRPTRTTWTRC